MSVATDISKGQLETKLWELTKPANPAKHNEEKAIDVIAVHGLNGERDASHWRNPDGSLWLRDLLPKDIRHARVYELTYDPKELFAQLTDGVTSVVHVLLARLQVARESIPKSRPVVFVAHGFGGFLVEQVGSVGFVSDVHC
ncbi:hypothetical protein BJX64DRAFT_224878 [Aspergillus heterothallicus]